PAVAPTSVLRPEDYQRLSLDKEALNSNIRKLSEQRDLLGKLLEAIKIMDKQRQTTLVVSDQEVDEQLYDGFVGDQDKTAMSVVRAAGADEIGSLDMAFTDPRLNELL